MTDTDAPDTSKRIEGEFPDARYFSIQAYDETFSPINVLRDFEIEPSVGVNHFQRKAATQLRGGTSCLVSYVWDV